MRSMERAIDLALVSVRPLVFVAFKIALKLELMPKSAADTFYDRCYICSFDAFLANHFIGTPVPKCSTLIYVQMNSIEK